jgi:AhpD family alkylhydroperoxidase
MKPMHQPPKRYYSPGAFVRATLDLLEHSPALVRALLRRRVSRTLAEKIQLAVTGVNQCRYCAFAHTRLALRQGVSTLEIAALLGRDLSAVAPAEAVALAFAQHYAATGGRPGAHALRRLHAVYGRSAGQDIASYTRFIQWANLTGNMVDHGLARCNLRTGPRI